MNLFSTSFDHKNIVGSSWKDRLHPAQPLAFHRFYSHADKVDPIEFILGQFRERLTRYQDFPVDQGFCVFEGLDSLEGQDDSGWLWNGFDDLKGLSPSCGVSNDDLAVEKKSVKVFSEILLP